MNKRRHEDVTDKGGPLRKGPYYITSKSIRDQFINFKEGDEFTADMLYYGTRDVHEIFPVYEAHRRHRIVERAWSRLSLSEE